ncbi:MAG: threonylcarbamoyl-AMP synthase [Planctomycetes bacterium]|nr:threonylcarbamoyl-AMP synthase [Planctomycetota bacterium]
MVSATRILATDADSPDAAVIAQAAETLRAGGLVAFPTETVYGLGANALDARAVAGIFIAKGRPAGNPLIVHVANTQAARVLVADWPGAADLLAKQFWPGPLTLVMKKSALVPDIVTAGGPTVALRVPGHKLALAILDAAGVPVAAPSANRSAQLSPTRAEHVVRDLLGRVDVIVDAGPTAGGLESTVLDLTTTPPRLLRPGLVSPAEIEAIVGPIERRPVAALDKQPLRSPGLLERHYSPRTPIECLAGSGVPRVTELTHQGQRIGWLRLAATGDVVAGVTLVLMPDEPAAYAAMLYAVLHELDAAGLDRIIVELPPRTEPWLAIHDRLGRM